MHNEEHINRLIAAVASKVRRVMLVRLAERPCRASELATRCGCSLDATAADLAILAEARLIAACTDDGSAQIRVTDEVTVQRRPGTINLCVADTEGTFIRMALPEELAPPERAASAPQRPPRQPHE